MKSIKKVSLCKGETICRRAGESLPRLWVFIVTFVLMKVRYFIIVTLLLFASWSTVIAQMPTRRAEKEKQDYRDALISTGAVLSNIQRYFVDTVDLSKVNAMALNAMLQRLDPYTQYMTSEEAKIFVEATTGSYAGIGAIISQRPDSSVIINEPFRGMPADLAGLKAGDLFLTINGKDFSKSTTPLVSKALRGEDDSSITLVVKRLGVEQPLSFSFKRKDISLSSVPYFGRIDGNIGVIRLNSFTRDTGKDVRNALTSLMAEGALSGLVLDLRSNGGGILQTGVELLGLFLPKGTSVVKVRGRQSDTNADYVTTSEPMAPNLPMAVLINEESASTSEIVAGALQDTDRAVVLGKKSFGKGLVQSTVPLPEGALLKLTTAQYYIPSGRNIQKIAYHHFNETQEKADEPDDILGENLGLNEDLDSKSPADSLGKPFYTNGGRVVYASDGILPDLELPIDTLPIVVSFMSVDTLVFDYITRYVAAHPKASASAKDFRLSDAEFADFARHLAEKKFDYKPGSLYLLDKLGELLKAEGKAQYTAAEEEALRKAIRPDIHQEIERHKEIIKDFLENQIVLRLYYREGFYERTLLTDSQILSAAELLKNQQRYASILMPSKTSQTASQATSKTR